MDDGIDIFDESFLPPEVDTEDPHNWPSFSELASIRREALEAKNNGVPQNQRKGVFRKRIRQLFKQQDILARSRICSHQNSMTRRPDSSAVVAVDLNHIGCRISTTAATSTRGIGGSRCNHIDASNAKEQNRYSANTLQCTVYKYYSIMAFELHCLSALQ